VKRSYRFRQFYRQVLVRKAAVAVLLLHNSLVVFATKICPSPLFLLLCAKSEGPDPSRDPQEEIYGAGHSPSG
jgi:hypothetical protein